jgi:glycerate-2-kinase
VKGEKTNIERSTSNAQLPTKERLSTKQQPAKRFYSVSYSWNGEDGKKKTAGTVVEAKSREDARRRFKRVNDHVDVFGVEPIGCEP